MDKSDISLTEHWFFGIFYLVLVKGNKIKFLTIKFKKKKLTIQVYSLNQWNQSEILMHGQKEFQKLMVLPWGLISRSK